MNVGAALDNNAPGAPMANAIVTTDASTPTPARTAATDPVTALLSVPGTVIQTAAGLLAAVVTPLLAPFTPATPTETPLMWGVLAWARRQFDTLLGVSPAPAAQTPTGQLVNAAATVTPAAAPVAGASGNTPTVPPNSQTLAPTAAAIPVVAAPAAPALAAPAATNPVGSLLTTVGTVVNTVVGTVTNTVGTVTNTVGAVVNTLSSVLTPNTVLPGDQTAALQAQLDALKPGDTLTLQANTTYQHGGVLYIRVPDVTINGNGATLQATNAYSSAVQITAAGVTVNDLNLTAPAGWPRYDGNNESSLVVTANGATINNVNITNSASVGVLIGGVNGFSLNNVNISNTMADGVQMTGGASNGTLNNVTVTNSGDDGIAIVSYSYAGVPVTPNANNITITNPVVNGSAQRGITVAGADTVTITNPTISNTNSSGIYIGSQLIYPYAIQTVNNVTITGGTVNHADTGILPIGAVTVASILAPVTNVTISGLTISNTPPTALVNIGLGVIAGSMSNIVLRNIAIVEQPPLTPVFPLFLGPGSYTASGFTMNGMPINA